MLYHLSYTSFCVSCFCSFSVSVRAFLLFHFLSLISSYPHDRSYTRPLYWDSLTICIILVSVSFYHFALFCFHTVFSCVGLLFLVSCVVIPYVIVYVFSFLDIMSFFSFLLFLLLSIICQGGVLISRLLLQFFVSFLSVMSLCRVTFLNFFSLFSFGLSFPLYLLNSSGPFSSRYHFIISSGCPSRPISFISSGCPSRPISFISSGCPSRPISFISSGCPSRPISFISSGCPSRPISFISSGCPSRSISFKSLPRPVRAGRYSHLCWFETRKWRPFRERVGHDGWPPDITSSAIRTDTTPKRST